MSKHEDDISNHKDDIDDWKALEHHHFWSLLCIHLFLWMDVVMVLCKGPHDEPPRNCLAGKKNTSSSIARNIGKVVLKNWGIHLHIMIELYFAILFLGVLFRFR